MSWSFYHAGPGILCKDSVTPQNSLYIMYTYMLKVYTYVHAYIHENVYVCIS